LTEDTANVVREDRVTAAADAFGLSRRTLNNWLGEGCPYSDISKPGQRRSLRVNIDEVRAWAEANGKELPEDAVTNADDPLPASPEDTPDGGTLELGSSGVRRRCQELFNLLDGKAVQIKELPEVEFKRRNVELRSLTMASQELRQLLRSLAELEDREGQVIHVDTVRSAVREIASGIRGEMVGLSRRLATDLTGPLLEELKRAPMEHDACMRLIGTQMDRVVNRACDRMGTVLERGAGLGDAAA